MVYEKDIESDTDTESDIETVGNDQEYFENSLQVLTFYVYSLNDIKYHIDVDTIELYYKSIYLCLTANINEHYEMKKQIIFEELTHLQENHEYQLYSFLEEIINSNVFHFIMDGIEKYCMDTKFDDEQIINLLKHPI